MPRKPYPTDVSDEEWSFAAPYLVLMTQDAPQREHSLREVFNALRWQKERDNQQAMQDARNAADDAYRETERSVEDLSRRLTDLGDELAVKQQELVRLRGRAASVEAQETSRREQMTELRRPTGLPPPDAFGVM